MNSNSQEPFAAHVYVAISAVTLAMSKAGISKSKNNATQGYKFRGIDEVYNALSSVLADNKLCVLPRVLSREAVERQSGNGKPLYYVAVEVEFDLVSAIDGSKHVIRTIGEAMDSADKATNKAMSAAMKYACLMAFQIPTEGDNDADAHTPEPAARKAPPASAPQLTREQIDPLVEHYVSTIDKAAAVSDLMAVYTAIQGNASLPAAAKEYVTQLLSTKRRKLEGKAA
jgi:hypothetical protein